MVAKIKNLSASRKQDLVVCILGVALVCLAKLIS